VLVDVKVPVLAESVAEATLMNWHKKVGDTVKRGDSLIDIETDKVTLEVAALNDGVLCEIIKGDGEIVQSDEIIARIDTEASASTVSQPEQSEPEQQSLPEMEEGKQTDASAKLSPAVRNLVEEHQLDIDKIPTRSDDGRITKEDILNFLEKDEQAEVKAAAPAAAAEPPQSAPPEQKPEPTPAPAADTTPPKAAEIPVVSNTTSNRPEEKVPMTRLRKRAAERLLSAQHENAILTTFNEVNMQAVMDIRARYKDEFEKAHGIKLGFMSFFTKATVEALKKFPLVNASVDGDNIVYHGYFDIGIAVSSPRGLVVPIVRDADLLSLADIEAKIREYGEKANNGKLTLDDLTGGTFTITNGGVFGSLLSTPIINPPQSAILGMHKIQPRPVAEDGEMVIRPMMYLALYYDHRIIDGREAVQFLVAIKDQLEDPSRMLLQL